MPLTETNRTPGEIDWPAVRERIAYAGDVLELPSAEVRGVLALPHDEREREASLALASAVPTSVEGLSCQLRAGLEFFGRLGPDYTALDRYDFKFNDSAWRIPMQPRAGRSARPTRTRPA